MSIALHLQICMHHFSTDANLARLLCLWHSDYGYGSLAYGALVVVKHRGTLHLVSWSASTRTWSAPNKFFTSEKTRSDAAEEHCSEKTMRAARAHVGMRLAFMRHHPSFRGRPPSSVYLAMSFRCHCGRTPVSLESRRQA